MNIQQRLTRLERDTPKRSYGQSTIDYLNAMIDNNDDCPSDKGWQEIDAGRHLNPVDIVLIAYGLKGGIDTPSLPSP